MENNNTCKNCRNWLRYSISDFVLGESECNVGCCSVLTNEVSYWDGIDVAQEKVEDAKIGCENLYTHQNFGCIHFEQK